MNRQIWLILASVIGLLVVASVIVLAPNWMATTNKTVVTLGELPPISYPGFELWPTPRTFDQPGTAFILKGDRIEHFAELIKPYNVGKEALVSATTTGKWKGALLAQFLGPAADKFSIKSDQDIVVKLELSDGDRWRIERPALEEAIRQLTWPDKEEGTPYVVTEAISINSIHYVVTLSGGAEGSLDTSGVGSLPMGTVTAEKRNDGSYVLKQVFAEPHFIFYQASRVDPGRGLSRDKSDTDQLKWTTEILPSSVIK